MDEIVMRLSRTIASHPRMRIYSCLVRDGEQTPTQLMRKLHMPLNALSAHLRMLLVAGLLSRRKSGAWCFFSAKSPYDSTTLSGRLTAWLRCMLKSPAQILKQHLGLHEVRDVADAETILLETLFEAATAFTDLRRIQLLRFLSRRGGKFARELGDELSMSPQALNRHVHKLMRRGYIRASISGHAVNYELCPTAKTDIHQRLFEIVRVTWDSTASRTS